MNKFMLGVISSIGATILGLGLGKLIYDKGRRDQAREIKTGLEQLSLGIAMGEKTENVESK